MNRSDLERLLSIGLPRELLAESDDCGHGLASEVHRAMLDALRQQPGRRGRARPGSADVDQVPLVTALNGIATRLIAEAGRSLRSLVESGCALSGINVDYDGREHAWRTPIKDIPLFADQMSWLCFAEALFTLPIKRQHEVAELIRVEKELELARIHLNFAREDQLPDKVVELQMEVASMSSRLVALRRDFPDPVKTWLDRNQSVTDALGWEVHMSAPLAEPKGSAEPLIHMATAYEDLGLRMQLLSDTGESHAQTWSASTASSARLYQDCGRGLRVIGWWLRALGSADTHKRCELCFRHRGLQLHERCEIHKRTSRQRLPRREELVAEQYRRRHRALAEPDGIVGTIADAMNRVPDRGTVRAIERLGLPDEIHAPALRLSNVLRWMYPALSVRLRRAIAAHFRLVLASACRPFRATTFASAQSKVSNQVERSAALRSLNWDRFFGSLFASVAGKDVALGTGLGRAIDIDHPLASTRALISERKLVDDISRLRDWVEADFATDEVVYLSDARITQEFQREEARLGRRPTLRELGRLLHASPETIRKALARGSGSAEYLRQRGPYATVGKRAKGAQS